MAQFKAEYEEITEFPEIANKLVKKYPDIFDELDVSKIKCVAITNKERKDRAKIWTIKAVGMPMLMDCPYAYYLMVYMSDWAEMTDKHKNLLVADALLSIPTDDNQEGKLNKFDLNDFDVMIRTFGVDYLSKDEVPNILSEDVTWARQG